MLENGIPSPRQPSLQEILLTTAEQSAQRARIAVGSHTPRRQFGFMNELLGVAKTLSTKWGVDPRAIPLVIFNNHSSDLREQKVPTDQTPPLDELLQMPLEEALAQIQTSGAFLRFLMNQMQISEPELADKLKLSRSWVDKIKRGKRDLDIGNGYLICEVLKIEEPDPRRTAFISLITQEERERAKRAFKEREKIFDTTDAFSA